MGFIAPDRADPGFCVIPQIMDLVLMAIRRYTDGWTALRFAVEPNRTHEEGSMVVYFRIAVALLICCVVPSSVIAQEKPKIFLGASSKTLGYSPLWVGARKGFFEQQGLDVQLVLLRGMPMTVQALSAGSLHIASGGAEPYIDASERGLDFILTGGVINGTGSSSSQRKISRLMKNCAGPPLARRH